MRLERNGLSVLLDDDFEVPKHLIALRLDKNGYPRLGGYHLHRLVMGETPPNRVVDHINRDKLDCRRANLRFVTRAQNMQNQDRKGVSWFPQTGQWRARIAVNRRQLSLGLFNTFEEARAAYLQAKFTHHIGA